MTSSRLHIFVSGVVGGVIGALLTTFLFLYPILPSPESVPVSVEPALLSEANMTDVSQVVETVNPAVVSIVISKDVPVYEDGYTSPFGFSWPFSLRTPNQKQVGTEKRDVGGGSGFFVTSDGYVVTNAHVVSDEEAIYTVFTNGGDEYEAEVIARDPILDIALLKIDSKEEVAFLQFGDSSAIKLGQSVIAIGNALAEFQNSVSVGVISGLSRSIEAGDGVGRSEQLENVIQTDAAINPGNSGGPLLNTHGEVIGVNVAVASGSENIGFALPGNAVKAAVDSIREHGRVVRAYLGVRYVPITPALAKANGLEVEYGVLVARGESVDQLAVIPGSPADKAGLVENDLILEIDGQKLDERHSLASIVRSKSIGDTIHLKVLHRGEEETREVTLGESPE